MSRRTAAWFAWSLWALCVVLAAFAVLLALYTPPGPIRDDSNWGVVIAVSLLTYPTVGAFVASRRPENLIGWILCGVGFLFVIEGLALAYSGFALWVGSGSLPGEKLALWISGWFDFPMVVLGLAVTILLFPNGRLPTPNWRAVLWVAVGGGVLWTIWWATRPGQLIIKWFFGLGFDRNPFAVGGFLGDLFDMLGRLGAVALLVMCAASVIGVFIRLGDSQGEERQQIKWFAYGAAFLLGAPFLIAPGVGGIIEAMGGSWEVGLASPVLAGLLGLPIALGVAILKYRLYDIDVIINRTLVYGMLTVLLAAGYVATIMAFQGIGSLVYQVPFRALFGQESALATVAATLAMAALFNPLRRRIQSFIDRRFYRSKYDTIKTLEAFSVKLRDETDLEALNEDLVGVVRETMQPAHLSLWLRTDSVQKSEQSG
jgi:hypothetical protein